MLRKYMAIALTFTLMFAGPAIAKMECRFDKEAYISRYKSKYIKFVSLVEQNKRDEAVSMLISGDVMSIGVIPTMTGLKVDILQVDGDLLKVQAYNADEPDLPPFVYWTSVGMVHCSRN